MANNRYFLTAERVINDVAVEVGLNADADPVGSVDPAYVQLTRLLNIALDELAEANQWTSFTRAKSFTTNSVTSPDGRYDLPEDFHYMIPQTHWDRSNYLPLGGPLSAQDWTFLEGRDLNSSTIYASFRQVEGVLALYPTPPSDNLEISYEYQSRNWVRSAADSTVFQPEVLVSNDIVLYPPSLIRAYLRAKWLSAKGFNSISADQAVEVFLNSTAGNEKIGKKLNMGASQRYPYLDPYRNTRDTGYGSS